MNHSKPEPNKEHSMKPKHFLKTGCLIVTTANLLFVVSTHADTPALVFANDFGFPPSSFTGTRGWEFGHHIGTTNDILITQLGVFDSGGDGLGNAHAVGLWREAPGGLTGTLLASATVPAGTNAPLIDGYRWVSIPPVVISYDLTRYVVGAQFSAGDTDALLAPRPSAIAPDIGAFLTTNGKLAVGPDLAYPAYYSNPTGEGQVGEQFYTSNFQYVIVPEPSVPLLLAPGLAYMLLRHRKLRW